MAKITIDGLDQIMGGLNRKGGRLRGVITEALQMSAKALTEQLKKEDMSSFRAPTGELGGHLTTSPVGHAAGASMIDVYAKGNYIGVRGAPRRAGLVAAMVENKHKNPWNARAMKRSEKRINAIIAETLRGE